MLYVHDKDSAKKYIQQALISTLSANIPVSDLSNFFTENYTQWVDGKTMSYKEFLLHAAELKKVVLNFSIEIQECIWNAPIAADIHTIHVMKKDGKKLHFKVIAFFTFDNNKISHVNEMTYLLQGDTEDKNLGSRTHT